MRKRARGIAREREAEDDNMAARKQSSEETEHCQWKDFRSGFVS